MGILKWYKRDPQAALVGMHGLTLEQCGAYNIVLDLIYCHDGAVHDDDHFIAGHMSVDVRTWRRLKVDLIAAGKLYTDGGQLRNRRADREVDAAQHRYRSASDAGTISAMKRGAKSFKFNNISSTPVRTTVATNHNHIERDNSDSEIRPTQNGHDLGDFGSPTRSLATALPTGALARGSNSQTNSKLKPLAVSPQLEAIIKASGWDDD